MSPTLLWFSGITNFLVGAMDQQIGEAMVKAGIPCFAMYQPSTNHSGVGSDHLQWGGESFHKMVGARNGGVTPRHLGVRGSGVERSRGKRCRWVGHLSEGHGEIHIVPARLELQGANPRPRALCGSSCNF